MKYRIEVPTSIVEESFALALSQPANLRGDFLHEIRSAFKTKLENVFIRNGIDVNTHEHLGHTYYLKGGKRFDGKPIIKYTGYKKDIKLELDLGFCSGYGHDDYSLGAINYTEKTPCELPSLHSFSLSRNFSIGNILILPKNGDYEIELSLGDGINMTGYAYDIAQKKKKSFFCLFGVWFDSSIIQHVLSKFGNIRSENIKDDLDEIRIGIIQYPMIYIHRVSGELFTCSCFEGYFDIQDDIVRLLPYGDTEPGLREHVQDIKIAKGICHLCNGGIPKREYGHKMYYSAFLQRYLPYQYLLAIKRRKENIVRGRGCLSVEDELRERFGYPRVGEKWVSETMLYKIVCMLFPNMEVVHHYRGDELEGLELDIWLPEGLIGIEYQGEQHYQAIDHWGGEEGLKKRIENDKKKKRLCKELGYHLIEYNYNEDLSEEIVKRRVLRFLEHKT